MIPSKDQQAMPRLKNFWTYVDVKAPEQCWPWKGTRQTFDYGCYGKKLAHRFLVEQSLGRTLTRIEVVMHTCDNPPCVNPNHLQLATQKDNLNDARRKGRWRLLNPARGERARSAKLTTTQVIEIRRRVASGEKMLRLARQFGVRFNSIWCIVNNRTWRHIGEEQ